MKGHGHKGHHHSGGHGKHHKASGGRTEMKVSGNPDVFKEAEDKHGTERKKGGKVVGHMHGKHSAHRMDRPKRKSGGRVGGGSDRSPMSSAHGVVSAAKESAHGQPD